MKHKTWINMMVIALLATSPVISPYPLAAWSITQDNISLYVDTTIDSNEMAYQVCSVAPSDCSLRGAISKANADLSQTYTIELPANNYGLTLSGAGEDDNASGDLDIRSSLTISGFGLETTIIDGNDLDRVLHIHHGAVVKINGVKIMGGRTADGEMPSGNASPGGGIYNRGYLSLTDCAVRDNTTGSGGDGASTSWYAGDGGDGGGIYNLGTLLVLNSEVVQNAAGAGGHGYSCWDCEMAGGPGGSGGSGGGIYSMGYLIVSGTTLMNNFTGEGGGGGSSIFIEWGGGDGGMGGGVYTSGPLSSIISSLIIGNITGDGGSPLGIGGTGGGVHIAAGRAELGVTNIRGNGTGNGGNGYGGRYGLVGGESGGAGGGIFNAGDLSLVDSFIEDNITGMGGAFKGPGGFGGGIYNAGWITLVSSAVRNNSTGSGGYGEEEPAYPGEWSGSGGNGGGISNEGTMLISDSPIEGNRTGTGTEARGSGGSGGGIFNSGTLGLTYSMVISNTTGVGGTGSGELSSGPGGDGGGIFNTGSLELSYSLVKANLTGRGGKGVDDPNFDGGGPGGRGGHGGGIYNRGELSLDGISILQNHTGLGGSGGNGTPPGLPGSSGSGGGVYILDSSKVTLSSTLIAANQVGVNGFGSGMYFLNASPDMLHITLASNTGGDGSGIHAQNSAVTLTNTILVSHTVGITASVGNTITLDYTLLGSGSWANVLDFAVPGGLTHTNDLSGNPGFIAPNLGDYHIGAGSMALDQGVGTSVTTDVDNQPRPNPGTNLPDLGADEYWALIPITAVSISGPVTGTAYTPVTLTTFISPPTATPYIHYVWSPLPASGQGIDTVVYTWKEPGEKTVTVTAENAGSSASATYDITIFSARLDYYLPLVTR